MGDGKEKIIVSGILMRLFKHPAASRSSALSQNLTQLTPSLTSSCKKKIIRAYLLTLDHAGLAKCQLLKTVSVPAQELLIASSKVPKKKTGCISPYLEMNSAANASVACVSVRFPLHETGKNDIAQKVR